MKKQLLILVIIAAFIAGSMQLSSCGAKKENAIGFTKENSNGDKLGNGVKEPESKYSAGGTDLEKNKTVASDASGKKPDEVTQSVQKSKEEPVSKPAEEKIPAKIIKTADISMQVKDMKESRKVILAIVQKSGGYVASENEATSYNTITNEMSIRIQPEGFDNILDKLVEQAIYVDYKKITAQDVTADYVDTQVRLKSKKEVEERYSDILKKANTVGDILEVEEKIRQIQEEIEATEGKLKYLNDQVGYSTINLNLYEKIDYQPSPDSGFLHKLNKAFKAGWNGLQIFFIGIIYLWPLWVLSVAVLYFILWLIKINRKKKQRKG